VTSILKDLRLIVTLSRVGINRNAGSLLILFCMLTGMIMYGGIHWLDQPLEHAINGIINGSEPHIVLHTTNNQLDGSVSINELDDELSHIESISHVETLIRIPTSILANDSIQFTTLLGVDSLTRLLDQKSLFELRANETLVDTSLQEEYPIGTPLVCELILSENGGVQPTNLTLIVAGYLPLDTIIYNSSKLERGYLQLLMSDVATNVVIVNLNRTLSPFLGDIVDQLLISVLVKLDQGQIQVNNPEIMISIVRQIENDIVSSLSIQVNYVDNIIERKLTRILPRYQGLIYEIMVIWIIILSVLYFLLMASVEVLTNDSQEILIILRKKGITSQMIQRALTCRTITFSIFGTITGCIIGYTISPWYLLNYSTNCITGQLPILSITLIVSIVVVTTVLSLKSRINQISNYQQTKSSDMFSRRTRFFFNLALVFWFLFVLKGLLGISFGETTFSGRRDVLSYLIIAFLGMIQTSLQITAIVLFPLCITGLLIARLEVLSQLITKTHDKFSSEAGKMSMKTSNNSLKKNGVLLMSMVVIASIWIGMSLQSNSISDIAERESLSYIGSDACIIMPSSFESDELDAFLHQIPGDIDYSVEYRFEIIHTSHSLSIRAIDHQSWSSVAYYENAWTPESNFEDVLENLGPSQIILTSKQSIWVGKGVGEEIVLTGINDTAIVLEVIGVIGTGFDSSLILNHAIIDNQLMESFLIQGSIQTRVLLHTQTISGEKVLHNLLEQYNLVDRLIIHDINNLPLEDQYELTGRLLLNQISIFYMTLSGILVFVITSLVLVDSNSDSFKHLRKRGLSRMMISSLLSRGIFIWVSVTTSIGVILGVVSYYGSLILRNHASLNVFKSNLVFASTTLGVICWLYVLGMFSTVMLSYVKSKLLE